MPVVVRVATVKDIPGMHRVRLAVHENRLTSSAVTVESYEPAIQASGRGWVAVLDEQILGFAVGNRETGNIWALFVAPAAAGQGLGRRLHDEMISWLFAQGCGNLWLSTEPGTRAQRFYESAGWEFKQILPNGEALYELRAKGNAT
jgi:GNAT superfamily N-acetyltransferase